MPQNIEIKIIFHPAGAFQAVVIDPEQAEWLAKRNGTLSAETFTLKHNGLILWLNKNSSTIEHVDKEVFYFRGGCDPILVKDNLIYTIRRLRNDVLADIARKNGHPVLKNFVAAYANSTLSIDAVTLKITRNQTAEKLHG